MRVEHIDDLDAKREAAINAARALADFCWRSVNVGPITKNPRGEANLWRNLRAALDALE